MLKLHRPIPQEIKKAQQQLKAYIEKGEPLKNALSELRNGLEALPEWQEALQQAQQTGAQHQKIRIHTDKEYSEWLNLPFALLAEQHTHLYLSKSLEGCYRDLSFEPNNPLPLKILVMISSPEDTQISGRLSYEEEEMLLLEAFEPLMQSGLVEVDYTDDGSLEALNRKLNENHYHILHFSGHGTFKDGEGYLELEDPETLRRSSTTAKEFADTLRNKPEHMPALVMLSACKTAEGNDALQGTTQALLQCQIPAVIGMSHSIKDDYAIYFSSFFYQALADKISLHEAFNQALQKTKDKEFEENKKAGNLKPVVQWLIPQLFVSQEIEVLVNWEDEKTKKLDFSQSYRYVLGDKTMIGDKKISPVFIGRRKDKAKILKPFMDKQPILLQGQGGVGKTNMAAYLIKRLISKQPNTQPFIFTEKGLTVDKILDDLEKYFEDVNDDHVVDEILNNDKYKPRRKFKKSLDCLQKHCTPVFLFDNIETFQEQKGAHFSKENEAIGELIKILCDRADCHLIVTGRYGSKDLLDIQSFDLQQVNLVDFWKKSIYLNGLKNIRRYVFRENILYDEYPEYKGTLPQSRLTFKKVIEILYKNFGGNYRILESLDALIGIQGSNKMQELLQNLEENVGSYKTEVLQEASKDLVFKQLLETLQPTELESLQYLAQFNIPVVMQALELQQGKEVTSTIMLDKLEQLTLLEKAYNYDLEEDIYYVSPIIKELLKQQIPTIDFKTDKAANYHYHVFNDRHENLGDLSEAFDYFCKANPIDVVALNDIGNRLSGFYYNSFLFRTAFYYAQTTVELLKEQTTTTILNHLGLILKLFGEYEESLFYDQQALKKYQQIGDKSGEGTTLNNIGQIYSAQGDYKIALEYLEKSLLISEQIGDKSGEGTTLNNIGQIHKFQGDYLPALSYLEKSLLISEQIGDKSGEGRTLNNMGTLAYAQGDYPTVLYYLEKSLLISKQIGDKSLEGRTLNNIANIYIAQGDYPIALSYLEKSLLIHEQIADKSLEGIILNNIASIYKIQGDYVPALYYLEKSLLISEQIGDKSGEGTTLSNIGQVYSAQGDYVPALSYLEKSLLISEQIGDKLQEGTTLNNISQIYSVQSDYVPALSYLEKSLLIREQIGDKSGMYTTLHNMAMMALKKQDLEKYMEYEVPAYQLASEINEARGIVVIGEALGNILCQMRRKQDGLSKLQRSFALAVQGGMPDAARLKAAIEQYS